VTIRRILVPIDFSEHSRMAVEWAATLAKAFDAGVFVLHVWEVPPYIPPEAMVGVPGQAAQTLSEAARIHAQQQMRSFVTNVRDQGGRIDETLLESGDPSRTIVEVSERDGYDLIVLGTHGRTGLTHLLMGSVAEKVLRRAKCPVLTVRAKDAGD
jgi:universal stress protein A